MSNTDGQDQRRGFYGQEPTRRDPHTGTEQVSSGQLSGRQAVGAGQETGYSSGDADADLGSQEGQLGGKSRAGVGPLGGQAGRGDTADAHAWKAQTGMAGPSGRRDDEEKLGVNSPDNNSDLRDSPPVSGSATTPNTPPAPDDDLGLPNNASSLLTDDAAHRPSYVMRGGLTGSSYRDPGQGATENRRDDEFNTDENSANDESANSDLNQPADSPLSAATAGTLANITPASSDADAGSPWSWQSRSTRHRYRSGTRAQPDRHKAR